MQDNDFVLVKKLVRDRKSIAAVEPTMQRLRQELKINDEKYYNMLITVTEAVNNAIIHGNKCNPEKNVELKIIANKKEVCISISDEGEGFDPGDVPDPRNSENLLLDHGRGIFLIRQLSNALKIHSSNSGTVMTIVFNL